MSADAEAAIPGDFAALLASDLTAAAPVAGDASALPSLPMEPVMRQTGRQDGKLAGKILPVALPVPLPVAAEEAGDSVKTTSAPEGDPAPEQAADAAPMTPVVLIGVAALPVLPALPEAAAAPTQQADSTPARDARVPTLAPAQAAAAVVSAEAQAPAPRGSARPTPDMRAVRFVRPDAVENDAATPALETVKLVEARAAARPAAEPQSRQTPELAATPPSGKAGRVTEPAAAAISTAMPAVVAGDPSSAMLVRDLPLQAAPAQPAPAPQAAPRVAPHDFATLVDRLVEARDAAGAHPVSAAIAHAEFGRVSLRFHQGDGALSVAMTSSDPGFAPAVAAAAASAQTATSQQQDNAAGQQRPEQQAQQQGGAVSGQGNPQAQSQGSAHHAQGRGGERAGQQAFDRTGDGQSETPVTAGASDTHRRGIYA